MRRDGEPSPHATPGSAGRPAPAWSTADLERRVAAALDFASVAVADFGESGYVDRVRPALGFGPEKVVAEAAMLAYVAHGACTSPPVQDRVDTLLRQLAPLVRSRAALVDMAVHPDRVFRRAVPHVLLTVLGHPDDAFDAFAWERCARVLSHAVDQPATVVAERRWVTSLWGRPFPAVPDPGWGTALTRPVDLLVGSREDPYGLTHLLFYVTDFGRAAPGGLGRPPGELLGDVEALVLRYLDHGDYDLVAELLMAWPQLREAWSPVAGFAFRVLAHVEDEVGVLPCGNVDPERLAGLAGAERTRYARAASYHTALVMGFLCAAALRSGEGPPTVVTGPEHPDGVWRAFRAAVVEETGDWSTVFDGCDEAEKRRMVPLLSGLLISQALRRGRFDVVRDTVTSARRAGVPPHPLHRAATDLLRATEAAVELYRRSDAGVRSTGAAALIVTTSAATAVAGS